MPSSWSGINSNRAIRRLALLNLAVAAVYAGGGWLGLQLAAPPGYATVIWPPSGLAVAAILFYGPSLSIGIFLGSFVVNCIVGGAFAQGSLQPEAIAVADVIAGGSTLQALLAATLVQRFFHRPIELKGFRSLLAFMLIIGPASCLIAATVGVSALLAAGIISPESFGSNWITWWAGDLLGVLVFLPLALLNPWRPWTVKWRGEEVTGFSVVTLLTVLVPLATTFYSWIIISDVIYQRNTTAFRTLADDSERALLHRIDSYKQSLDGGAGAFHASDKVTLQDWQNYVDTLEIQQTLPGINGIGFIEPVAEADLGDYAQSVTSDGVFGLVVHPQGEKFDNFIIKYIEPVEPNIEAVGLNIGFERNRYEAAVHARDTGLATITKRIFLVQDETRSAGFLLLRPLYSPVEAPATVEARRELFEGWVYAPFVAPRFMSELTSTQGNTVDFSVFDGNDADPDQLIYSSISEERADFTPTYTVRKTFAVMEQIWTVEWRSTPAFEKQVRSAEPVLVLLGGIVLSGLLGGLLLSFSRREESIRRLVKEKTQQLVASEQQTRSLVETAMVAILLLDEKGTVISANHATEGLFDSPASQIIGDKFAELIRSPEFYHQSLDTLVQDKYGANKAHREPLLTKTRFGEDLFLDIQLNSWTSSTGATRYTAIIRDVTKEIKAHIALEETEQRWKYALEGSDIGVFDVNLESGTSVVSAKWMEMLGFGPDDDIAPQAEWESRVHPEDMPVVAAADAACLNGEAERSVSEYRLRRKDGVWIWLRSDAVVVERDSDGNATRLIGTQTDITQLKHAAAALQASEERFRTAIEHAPVGMAMLSLDNKWIKANKALCDLLGYTEEELLASDPALLANKEDAEGREERLGKLMSGQVSTYQHESRLYRKNGSQVWVLISVSVATDALEEEKYFILQIQDITEHKEMERLKTEFVSTVSHELRTPLTSIRASLGLVLGSMAQALPQNAERLITIAHSNCERLVLLINDILDLEKISSGQMRFDMQRETVSDLLKQAIEANQGYADQYDVTLDLEEPVPDCVINIDAARFHQVLANLTSNAAKFSAKGGVVKIGAERLADSIRISVIDKGQGIPVEFRNKIFSRFSQADASSSRAKSGTGLGLYISKQIIEQLGGTIDFESTVGVGTTFWFTLPIAEERHDAPLNFVDHPDEGLPSILHVEDDCDFCEVVAAYLEGKVSITTTATVRGARALLAARSFDLAIIDIGLGQGNGLDLLDDIDIERTPVIVLSAREDYLDDDRVSYYLPKSRTTEKEFVDIVLDMVAGNTDGPEQSAVDSR
ncbi:MAG: hybrid sensor histidine kinase/response regulator [Ahrensia sp.]|nr:hybrid sensor histidine kinase/response regulator [Ahrensia sp.]